MSGSDPLDALQVAVARHHGLLLATRNTRDFPPDRFDLVRIPYSVEPAK